MKTCMWCTDHGVVVRSEPSKAPVDGPEGGTEAKGERKKENLSNIQVLMARRILLLLAM